MADEFDGFNFDAVDWNKMEHEVAPKQASPFEVQVISPEMLAKRMVWDVAPCHPTRMAPQVAKRMGLPPASAEVEEMEHDESHHRLSLVAPIAPIVEGMVNFATQAVVASIMEANDADLPEEDLEDAQERLMLPILQSVYAVLGNLMDVGLIHLPHRGYLTYGGQQ